MYSTFRLFHGQVYWVGPLCGGALAAFLYLVAFDWVDKKKSERHDFKQEMSAEGKE